MENSFKNDSFKQKRFAPITVSKLTKRKNNLKRKTLLRFPKESVANRYTNYFEVNDGVNDSYYQFYPKSLTPEIIVLLACPLLALPCRLICTIFTSGQGLSGP